MRPCHHLPSSAVCCLQNRYDQIVQAVLGRMQQDLQVKPEGATDQAAGGLEDAGEATSASPTGLDDASPTTMIWWAFLQLLQEHYIERAPPCNLPPLPAKSAAPVRVKKTAPKPGRRVKTDACMYVCTYASEVWHDLLIGRLQ